MKICKICGIKFNGKGRQCYCSDECRRIGSNIAAKESKERATKKRRNKKRKSQIDKINQEARSSGLSYGQYMAAKYMEERIQNERNKNGVIS